MNILHLSTIDNGGAGRATYRLHRNLKLKGYNSKILVIYKTIADPDILSNPRIYLIAKLQSLIRLLNYEKLLSKFKNKSSQKRTYFYRNRENSLMRTSNILESIPFKPDIIIAHWTSNFISPRHLYELNKLTDAPIIWYLMDMEAMTGGCHYAFNCLGYTKSCGNCPAINSKKLNDLSNRQWKEKYRYLQKTDITIVSPTSWLTKQANQSSIFSGKRIEQIMLALETDVFRPLPKHLARSELKLPSDKKIIFFGAQSILEERKGFKYLIEALSILKDLINHESEVENNIFIIIAGTNNTKKELNVPFPHKYMGLLKDDRTLALAYQAADVFVCPSIEDSGPMMINESILCGTPVVSFNMGVAPDLVHSGKTGYMAKLKDSSDMAYGIKLILELNKKEMQQMSNNCTNLGLKMCDPNVQTNAFVKLFDSLIAIENEKC